MRFRRTHPSKCCCTLRTLHICVLAVGAFLILNIEAVCGPEEQIPRKKVEGRKEMGTRALTRKIFEPAAGGSAVGRVLECSKCGWGVAHYIRRQRRPCRSGQLYCRQLGNQDMQRPLQHREYTSCSLNKIEAVLVPILPVGALKHAQEDPTGQ